jgi:adenylate cyclase class 2
MSGRKTHEVEIKLRVPDVRALMAKLRRLRARKLSHVWERNTLFDTARGRFRKGGGLLRLRVVTPVDADGKEKNGANATGSAGLLTYKGPSLKLEERNGVKQAGGRRARQRYKVREEVELEVGNPEKLGRILKALGLKPSFRYEKVRATYELRGVPGVKLDLDVTPVGTYLELEGPPRQIDRAARRLGYGVSGYITRSYLALHFEACRRRGVKPKDMVFPRKKLRPARKKQAHTAVFP